ncbi:MAG: 3-deoxy-7-phosphoheptulonate synthase [Bacillota bacterium]|nr:3-deoxy-7-phosphoheptulonate synthase [Bacillota bacterium]
MIIVMRPGAPEADIARIQKLLAARGLGAHTSIGESLTIIGVVGDKSRLDTEQLSLLPGVEKLVPIMEPYKLASLTFHPGRTSFTIKGVEFGGHELVQIAGPCAVESEEQLEITAAAVARAGAKVLRGGAYKPRTSPYSFQGLEREGLRMLRQAADRHGLLVISEITSEVDLEEAAEYVDIVQIGARNSQNFRLLSAVGRSGLPVLLKRGFAESIDELLSSTEYILSEGNYRLILCERGIRTFETATRSTLDLSAVPVLREKTHLPVFVDPSHAAGKASLVAPLARAAVAAGADGLIIEVHPDPPQARSDAAQQLTPGQYAELSVELARIAAVMSRGPDPA